MLRRQAETIDGLKDNIREAIGEIQLHTIDNVLKIKNWTDRVGYCMASRGSHLNDIIFHLHLKKSYLADPIQRREVVQFSCTSTQTYYTHSDTQNNFGTRYSDDVINTTCE